MSRGASLPSSICRIGAREGVFYLAPSNRLQLRSAYQSRFASSLTISFPAPCCLSAAVKTSQASRLKPNPEKNRALLASKRCSGLSRYSQILASSTIARCAFGSFMFRRTGPRFKWAPASLGAVNTLISVPHDSSPESRSTALRVWLAIRNRRPSS